ncbi:hypothetical protein vseg_003885 [Gypsophila vaccaria]
MDIDPLWLIGGCSSRFLSSFCMAQTNNTSSKHSYNINCYSKSHTLLTFVSLFFVILLLVNPAHQARSFSNMVSEPDDRQTLAASASGAAASTSSSLSTLSTSSFKPKHGGNLPSKQFEGDEHEVPSGPNPISNR